MANDIEIHRLLSERDERITGEMKRLYRMGQEGTLRELRRAKEKLRYSSSERSHNFERAVSHPTAHERMYNLTVAAVTEMVIRGML
jgi:hypothetical protein